MLYNVSFLLMADIGQSIISAGRQNRCYGGTVMQWFCPIWILQLQAWLIQYVYYLQSFQRVELWIRKSKIFVSFLRIASIKFFSSFKKEMNRDSFFNSFLFWWKTAQEFLALSRKTFLKIFEFRGISKLEKKTRNESSFFLLSFRKWIWNYRIFLFVNRIKNKERGFMNFWNDCSWPESTAVVLVLESSLVLPARGYP